MTIETVQLISDKVLSELKTSLSEKLCYHGVHHTMDVVKQSLAIAKREGISKKEDLLLLEIAAIYHDSGFLVTYKNHEIESCKKARTELPFYKFSESRLLTICGLIEATRIPQQPKNLLEQVIADADLDYLGRNDFQQISHNLQTEFITYGIIDSPLAFEELQLRFFESHEYFTKSSQQLRGPVKKLHYEELTKKFLHYRKNNKNK